MGLLSRPLSLAVDAATNCFADSSEIMMPSLFSMFGLSSAIKGPVIPGAKAAATRRVNTMASTFGDRVMVEIISLSAIVVMFEILKKISDL